MLFKKKKETKQHTPFPGQKAFASGKTVIHELETAFCDLITLDYSMTMQPVTNSTCRIERTEKSSDAINFATAASATGLRTAIFSNSKKTAQLLDGLNNAVAKHLPVVFHITSPNHAFLQQVIDNGAIVFYANDVQALADLSLIGRAAAERSLLPSIVLSDAQLQQSTQLYLQPEKELLHHFTGTSQDSIEAPTPAQEMIFGKSRRRVPRMVDIDKPLAVLNDINSSFAAHATAADFVFSAQHSESILLQCMTEFAQLTGRDYRASRTHATGDAQHIVVAEGDVYHTICPVVDYLARKENLKCGVLHLNTFTTQALKDAAEKLAAVRTITVIENIQNTNTTQKPLTRLLQQLLVEIHGKAGNFISAIDSGSAGKNSFAAYAAMVRNMALASEPQKHFFIDAHFSQPELRLPKLEMLQQEVSRNYPDAEKRTVPLNATEKSMVVGKQIRIFAETAFDDKEIALLCAAFTSTGAGTMQAWQRKTAKSAELQFVFSSDENEPVDGSKMLVVPDAAALANLPDAALPGKDGCIILQKSGVEITLPEHLHSRLTEKSISVFTGEFDSESAVAGAIARLFPFSDKNQIDKVKNAFIHAAEAAGFGTLSESFTKAFDSIKPVQIKETASTDSAVNEVQAPWTVQAVQNIDGSLFDLEKFWSRIGYLQAAGKGDYIAVDPFFAMKTMPAGSSTFMHAAMERGKIVQFIPENLQTDNLNFLQAFGAGVWATVQDLGTILKTAIDMQQENGVTFMQLPRMSDNLCKLAYRILQKDTVENYCYAGELYEKALVQLIEKMKPKEDQQEQLQEECEAAISPCRHLLLVKNRFFFDEAEKQAKGSGRVLIPTINPLECHESSQLIARLPENAAEEVDATAEVLKQAQQNWEFLWSLPSVELHELHLEENSLHSLLNKKVRAAILPASGANSGDGRQTALQLLTVALETTMQQKVAKLTVKITDVQKQLETKIQGDVSSASQINNFESYAQRLDELLENPDKPLNAANLAAIRENPEPDAEKIRELINARDALNKVLTTYENGANGFGRANTILAIDERVDVADFPYNNIKSPWLQVQPAATVTAVNGLFAGLVQQMSDTFLTIRNAENLLSKGRLLATTQLQWDDFSDEEKLWCPPVICVLPDAGRTDEFNAILTAAADKKPVKVVLLDAEPAQMSGSFLSPSHTVFTAGFLNNAHVLQAGIGDAEHLLRNAFSCMNATGPAVMQINTPIFNKKNAVDAAGFAIASRFAPLFSASAQDDDKILPGLDISANPQADQAWVEVQWIQRTREGILKQISEKLTPAHYLWLWPQFKAEFEEISQSSLNEDHVALTDYLQLAPEDRTGLTGTIRMLDSQQKLHISLVSERVVRLCKQTGKFWQLLQKLQAQQLSAEKSQEPAPATDTFSAVEKQELENRILQLEQQSDQVMHEKLKSQLLHLSGYAPGSPDFQETLRAFLAGIVEAKSEEV